MIQEIQIFLLGGLFFFLLTLATFLLAKRREDCPFRLVTAIAMIGWASMVIFGFLARIIHWEPAAEISDLRFIYGTLVLPLIAFILFTLIKQSRVDWKLLALSELPFVSLFILRIIFSSHLICTIDHIYAIAYSLGVLVYSAFRIRRFRRDLANSYSNLESRDLKWISATILSLLLLLVLFETSAAAHSQWATSAFLLSNFAIWGLIFIIIMNQQPADEQMLAESSRSKPSTEKYDGFKDELSLLMTRDKVFLDPEINIRSLATLLGTNTTYLSNYLNESIGKNFATFINDFRLDYAEEKLMADPDAKVEDVAVLAGFNSAQTFYRLFKGRNGCTPKQYRSR